VGELKSHFNVISHRPQAAHQQAQDIIACEHFVYVSSALLFASIAAQSSSMEAQRE
jgi:hypothetical protein